MTGPSYDVIVVGVGAMGSATVAELAARGLRVLGLERSGVPTETGSSGGVTRIIRLAYNEDPRYVPLVRRAYERWQALGARVGERLLITTGGIDAGRPDSVMVQGALDRVPPARHPVRAAGGAGAACAVPGLRLARRAWSGCTRRTPASCSPSGPSPHMP